jgi:hypothetical protein
LILIDQHITISIIQWVLFKYLSTLILINVSDSLIEPWKVQFEKLPVILQTNDKFSGKISLKFIINYWIKTKINCWYTQLYIFHRCRFFLQGLYCVSVKKIVRFFLLLTISLMLNASCINIYKKNLTIFFTLTQYKPCKKNLHLWKIRQIYTYWTSDGRIYVKKLETSRKQLVTNFDDIENIECSVQRQKSHNDLWFSLVYFAYHMGSAYVSFDDV